MVFHFSRSLSSIRYLFCFFVLLDSNVGTGNWNRDRPYSFYRTLHVRIIMKYYTCVRYITRHHTLGIYRYTYSSKHCTLSFFLSYTFFFFEKEEDLLGRMWNVGLRAERSCGKVRSGRVEGQLYIEEEFFFLYRVFGKTCAVLRIFIKIQFLKFLFLIEFFEFFCLYNSPVTFICINVSRIIVFKKGNIKSSYRPNSHFINQTLLVWFRIL